MEADFSKTGFSGLGYTQLNAYGEIDNSLEDSFGKIETQFSATLIALDAVVTGGNTELPSEVFDNLMWYCAYLWRMSPFAKATAPVEFVRQLDLDLGKGNIEILSAVGIQQSDIREIQSLHAKGVKFIINATDCHFSEFTSRPPVN